MHALRSRWAVGGLPPPVEQQIACRAGRHRQDATRIPHDVQFIDPTHDSLKDLVADTGVQRQRRDVRPAALRIHADGTAATAAARGIAPGIAAPAGAIRRRPRRARPLPTATSARARSVHRGDQAPSGPVEWHSTNPPIREWDPHRPTAVRVRQSARAGSIPRRRA